MTEIQLDSVCCTFWERGASFEYRNPIRAGRQRTRTVRGKAPFSSSYSMHPHRQKHPHILLHSSLLTISSGDQFFFIVPAEPVSCHTQQLSSPNREVSLFFPFDFLTFVSWSKHEGWAAWLLLRCSSLVLDQGTSRWRQRQESLIQLRFQSPRREWAP